MLFSIKRHFSANLSKIAHRKAPKEIISKNIPISTVLQQAASDFPNHKAIQSEKTSYNWSELFHKAGYLADSLISLGIKKGDLVSYDSNDPINSWLIQAACARAGFVIVSESSIPTAVKFTDSPTDSKLWINFKNKEDLNINQLLESRNYTGKVEYVRNLPSDNVFIHGKKAATFTNSSILLYAMALNKRTKMQKCASQIMNHSPDTMVGFASGLVSSALFNISCNFQREPAKFKTTTTNPVFLNCKTVPETTVIGELDIRSGMIAKSETSTAVRKHLSKEHGVNLIEYFENNDILLATNSNLRSCSLFPLSEQELKIISPFGEFMETNRIGIVCVKGPYLMKKFFGVREIDSFEPGHWFKTNLRGYLNENGFLYITNEV